jgi:TonB family protein
MQFIAQFPLLFLLTAALYAEPPDDPNSYLAVAPGIKPPRPIHMAEPKYTPQAHAAHVEGTVSLIIAIDQSGAVVVASVFKSLGYGLDEEAQATVRKWQFEPATKDGRPVKTTAVAEVNFRLIGSGSAKGDDRQRIEFNAAWDALNRPGEAQASVDQAVQQILDLSRKKYPPAMCVAGIWMTPGSRVDKDLPAGLDLIQKSADKNYAPALYELARRHIEGRDLPIDLELGLKEMHAAADGGSGLAQLDLGKRYAAGDFITADFNRSRKYLSLCAARGSAPCQYRLGVLLRQAPDLSPTDNILAVALLRLASEGGLTEAKGPAAAASLSLTPGQLNLADAVKRSLQRR